MIAFVHWGDMMWLSDYTGAGGCCPVLPVRAVPLATEADFAEMDTRRKRFMECMAGSHFMEAIGQVCL